MQIKLRYFASLREYVGQSEQVVDVGEGVTIQELWTLANPDLILPSNTLVAMNLEYVTLTEVIHEGDEIAFFPPVTGG